MVFDWVVIQFAYKIFRRDFVLPVPLPRYASYFWSAVVRAAGKFIGDYSGTLVFRAPDAFGGAYFTFSQVVNMVGTLVCALLYNEFAKDNGRKLHADWVMGAMTGAFAVWACLFAGFLLFICVPEYRATFWSTQTGWQYAASFFTDYVDNDEERFKIFDFNMMMWEDHIPDVEKWTHANWNRWRQEQPPWFTPLSISKVHDRFIPVVDLMAMGSNRERRGSASEDILKESFRKMSLGGGVSSERESRDSNGANPAVVAIAAAAATTRTAEESNPAQESV
jgi:hypothetical protein